MYDDRGRDYRDSRDGRSRDFDEEERRRQWDEYERAREEWERRVSEYKNGEVNQTPAGNSSLQSVLQNTQLLTRSVLQNEV